MSTPAEPAAPATGPEPTGTTGTDPQPAQPSATTATANGDTTDWRAEAQRLQAEADRWKANSRKNENGKKANNDLLAKVAEALGLDAGTKPDADQLTQQLTASQSEVRQSKVEAAVLRTAARLGVDGDALLDSRSFLNSLTDVDPSDSAAVEAAVNAVKTRFQNPSTTTADAVPTPPARSGAPINGSPGGSKPITEAELARMSPDQITKAYEDGRLAHLM
ncbi:hypothetical protein ACFRH4_08710 [Streptomyces mirabilis]|uniref:hypothetical protein n=1 Tax=Streptomyces mirabilis TaxID=68239 RepID=UPI00368730C3